MLSLALVFFAGFDYAIHRLVVYQSYLELEHDEAITSMQRCVSALKREIELLDQFASDWSVWDDTYRFLIDPNEEYIASNLPFPTFESNKLNLIYFD